MAEPALRRALKDSDVEVALRAKILLDKFDWGIMPETPVAVVGEIEAFRNGDDDARRRAAAALADQGPAGFKALKER